MLRLFWTLVGALSVSIWASATLAQDVTPPTVTSIMPASAGPSPAATETFTVTFSEPVIGVDITDFSLTMGGVSATITSATGSGSTHLITVSGIAGAGSLRLDLKSTGTGIEDMAGNAITGGYTSGGTRLVSLPAPVSVPTMTEWAMIMFGTILAGGAALYIQRRRLSV